jgi:hypothetical protein
LSCSISPLLKHFLAFVVLGLEFRAYTSSHSTSPFCEGFSRDRVSRTICMGWL